MTREQKEGIWTGLAITFDVLILSALLFLTFYTPPAKEIKVLVPRDMFKSEEAWKANTESIRKAYEDGELDLSLLKRN
jgi:hypothetical protein